jgi:hypothetical protein
MANLYYEPVFYGVEDVIVQGDARSFGLRIYYPSENDTGWEVPLRRGEYPLVVFAHGDRAGAPNLCPPDRTEDYKRWGAVLHLLARCGFVVAAAAMHDVFYTEDAGAARLEETVRWMRERWVGRGVLHHPAEFVEISAPAGSAQAERGAVSEAFPPTLAKFGPGDDHIALPLQVPTALGLVGHSWGVRACALAAVRGIVHPEVLAGVAGTFDSNASIAAVTGAHVPTLLMAGTEDSMTLAYLIGLWTNLPQPKHQVAILGVGHWDWFSGPVKIAPCEPGSSPGPSCSIGWKLAAELLVGFTTKYLMHQWQLPPSLLGDIGGRPPITPWLPWFPKLPFRRTGCALQIRWVDPTVPLLDPTKSAEGARTLGVWPTPGSPW